VAVASAALRDLRQSLINETVMRHRPSRRGRNRSRSPGRPATGGWRPASGSHGGRRRLGPAADSGPAEPRSLPPRG